MDELTQKTCHPCEGGVAPLTEADAATFIAQIHTDWTLNRSALSICRQFTFEDFHHTMAFVNAVAWIAHQEDHHPDMDIGYNHCAITFTTHAINGLSENDFICAAKIDRL